MVQREVCVPVLHQQHNSSAAADVTVLVLAHSTYWFMPSNAACLSAACADMQVPAEAEAERLVTGPGSGESSTAECGLGPVTQSIGRMYMLAVLSANAHCVSQD